MKKCAGFMAFFKIFVRSTWQRSGISLKLPNTYTNSRLFSIVNAYNRLLQAGKALYCGTVMRYFILFLLISGSVIGQDIQGLRYIENKGQWDSDIDFQALVPGGRLGVSAKGFSIVLLDMEELERRHLDAHGEVNEFNGQSFSESIAGHYFKINLVGSNQQSKPIVNAPLDGHYNYFLGNDTCRWARQALAFTSILYPDVYDGIDFRVSSIGKNLKYDFIVRPGADPAQIRIAYDGADRITKIDDVLEIQTTVGKLTEEKPFSYHLEKNNKIGVASEYRIRDNVVSFSFPESYDTSRELTIDPLLIFSTYSGSTADNWGSTATPGEHGTLYSAGVTRQDLGGFFPATVGAFQTSNRGSFDMAVIKYDSAGTKFLHATHLGGANNDSPQSLVVDTASGDLIVLGISSSPDYPTAAHAFDQTFNLGTPIFNRVLDTDDQWDIVVTRLSSNGSQLVGSTFLGGSGNDGLNLPKQSGGSLVVNYGDEMRGDVITDETGHVFISSVTSSNNFPIVGGFDNSFNGGVTDGLVVKLAPDLSSIIWSSYLGGTGFDAAYSIKFDPDKNLVLAGGTTSTNFPVTVGSYQSTFNGIVDGWIARVSSDGSTIMNATFTGTPSFDQVYFIDLDASGNVFCYGQTAGQMPVTAGVYRNQNSGQFLQKFSPDLTTLYFSTVFGSGSGNGLVTPNISPTAFLVNDCNNIYMAGWGGFVNSSPSTGYWQSGTYGMPVTNDAYQKTTSGSDFYFIVLNGDATELVYATYLGGNSSKTHVDGGTSRFDKYGIVYHAVCSGCSFGNTTGGASSDFPTSPNAKSSLNRSLNCNNAAFKFDLSSLRAMFDTNNLALTMPGFNNVCYPDSIVFQNLSTGGKSITWDFDDGTILNQTDTDSRNVIHQYQLAGQYHVKLKITDLSTCSQTDSVTKIINYFKDNIKVGDDGTVCEGTGFQLTASGGVNYTWTSEDGTFISGEQSPIVHPIEATSYIASVIDANGCSRTDSVNVDITPNVHALFQTYDIGLTKPGFNNVCYPEPIRFQNLSRNGIDYIWDFGDGSVPLQMIDSLPVVHAYQQQGVYQAKLTASNPNTCNRRDIYVKTIRYYKDQIEVGEGGEICEGATFQLTASGGNLYAWTAEGDSFVSSERSPSVRPLKSTTYYVKVTDINNCVRKDTAVVTVVDSVDAEWLYRLNGDCFERPSVSVKNLSQRSDDVIFGFDFGDGTRSEEIEIDHDYEKDGMYSLKFIAQRRFCAFEETVTVPVYKLIVPNVFTPEGSPGYNDTFEVAFGSEAFAPTDIGQHVELIILNRWGGRVYESMDYQNDWTAGDLEGGIYYVHVRVGEFATCKTWLHIVK